MIRIKSDNFIQAIAGGLALALVAIAGMLLSSRPVDGGGSPQTARQQHGVRRHDPPPSGAHHGNGIDLLDGVPQEEFAEKLAKIVTAWDEDRLSGSVADLFARQTDVPSAEALRLALLRRWASGDPGEAAAWAESLSREPDRSAAFDQIILAWSAINADAALDWLKSLPDDSARAQAWNTLAYEVSRENPAKGLDLALPLDGGPDGLRCIEHAVSNWALQDPQAALVRVKELSDVALRESALASVATSWAESDPSAAASLVAESMEPGPAQDRAVASIIQRWAQQDPAAAEAWAASFPESAMKQNARMLIAEQESVGDPNH